MGRRKTKKIKQSKSSLVLKNRHKLDKEFHCHFCQHDRSVSIKIDMRSGVGFLSCRICGVNFSTRITSLDEPIDVYTTWMDKCRETDKILSLKEHNSTPRPENRSSNDLVNDRSLNEDASDKFSNVDLTHKTSTLNGESTDPSENAVYTFNRYKSEEGLPESSGSSRQPEYTTQTRPDLQERDLNLDDQFNRVSRNKFSERIIGGDEVSDGTEDLGNADARVHDLFRDDD